MTKRIKYIAGIFMLNLIPFLTGCLFESVNQPSTAEPGEIINVSLVITDNLVPEPNAHKGVLGILVPVDWDFISASYSSVLGNGSLDISAQWKDSVDLFFPTEDFGPDMKWIVLLSDQGYAYNQITSFNVQLTLKVGQTPGCFNLGYLTSKATSGLISSGNPSWVPVSYPHRIAVPDSSLCSSFFEVRTAPEWDNLFDRHSGWTGSDGIYSIPLNGFDAPSNTPADSQLILFSDTFIGQVDSNNRRLNASLINNTLALMPNNIPDPNNIQFFWRTLSGVPKAVFVPATPEAQPGDWYWLMDGITINHVVYVFALRLNSSSGGFGFEINGVALIKFRMDTNNFITDVQQFDTPLFYKNQTEDREIVIGQAVMSMTSESGNPSPDGYIYIYGPNSSSSGKKLLAARVLPQNIENFNSWEYWNGTAWGNDITSSASITTGISQEFSVTPLQNGKFLLVFQMGISVAFRLGESPVGPFGIFHAIYECPEVLTDPDIFVYNAKAHPSLSNEEEMLISYNVNTFDFLDHFSNADIYRPRFIYLKFTDSTTSVDQNEFYIPTEFKLNQNFPNPFNPATRISFAVPQKAKVKIEVFNTIGQTVTNITDRYYEAGIHYVDFSANNLPSGVYFYRMESENFLNTKKMILMR
jgi:hypothetical protein